MAFYPKICDAAFIQPIGWCTQNPCALPYIHIYHLKKHLAEDDGKLDSTNMLWSVESSPSIVRVSGKPRPAYNSRVYVCLCKWIWKPWLKGLVCLYIYIESEMRIEYENYKLKLCTQATCVAFKRTKLLQGTQHFKRLSVLRLQWKLWAKSNSQELRQCCRVGCDAGCCLAHGGPSARGIIKP